MRQHRILLALAMAVAAPLAHGRPPPEVLPHAFALPGERAERSSERFAQRIDHRVSSDTQGAWRVEGRPWGEAAIWEYSARVADAVTMSAHVGELALPGGARLHVAGASGEEQIFGEGAIRPAGIWTGPQRGDTIHLRLEVPRAYAGETSVTVAAFFAGVPRDGCPPAMPAPAPD